ncbi:hypothetical protein G9A89_021479 [Geosiphon pyriformis]|nr:hypothetical protein G9A89_021479 [Geosiphon pyriformis]
MDLVGFSAGTSSLNLAGLEFWSDSKKIKARIESIYSHSLSYKKMKLPGVSGSVVNSLDGLLSVGILHGDGVGLQRSWGSEIDSEKVGVSEVLDAKNLENIVAKETSYMDPNTSEIDEIEDDATLRKMQTRTFVLEWPPKTIFFASMKHHTFEPVKLFILDVELSNVSGKTNSNKLISIKKIFYRVDGFGGASTSSKFSEIIRSFFTFEISLNKARELTVNRKILVNDNLRKANICLNQKIIVKEILVNLLKVAVESVFSKFGKIISIKMQLIGLWQKALVEFDSSEITSSVASM